jgi:hypothetical protein
MTGQYQYAIGQQRVADLRREAERARLAASVPSRAVGNATPMLFTRLRSGTPPARGATT